MENAFNISGSISKFPQVSFNTDHHRGILQVNHKGKSYKMTLSDISDKDLERLSHLNWQKIGDELGKAFEKNSKTTSANRVISFKRNEKDSPFHEILKIIQSQLIDSSESAPSSRDIPKHENVAVADKQKALMEKKLNGNKEEIKELQEENLIVIANYEQTFKLLNQKLKELNTLKQQMNFLGDKARLPSNPKTLNHQVNDLKEKNKKLEGLLNDLKKNDDQQIAEKFKLALLLEDPLAIPESLGIKQTINLINGRLSYYQPIMNALLLQIPPEKREIWRKNLTVFQENVKENIKSAKSAHRGLIKSEHEKLAFSFEIFQESLRDLYQETLSPSPTESEQIETPFLREKLKESEKELEVAKETNIKYLENQARALTLMRQTTREISKLQEQIDKKAKIDPLHFETIQLSQLLQDEQQKNVELTANFHERTGNIQKNKAEMEPYILYLLKEDLGNKPSKKMLASKIPLYENAMAYISFFSPGSDENIKDWQQEIHLLFKEVKENLSSVNELDKSQLEKLRTSFKLLQEALLDFYKRVKEP